MACLVWAGHSSLTKVLGRNQGADYSRILVGLQVPPKDDKALATLLDALGYPYAEETNNPVYRMFLRS